MENVHHHNYIYLGMALVSLLVVALAKRRRSRAHSHGGLRLPPGPWQLSGIGSLHHVAWQWQLPHRAMRNLARRHRPVMLLRVGAVPTLVVSSRDAARKVLKTHDAAFASRPLSATFRALTKGGRSIILAPYGERWRQLRRLAVTELLSAHRVLSFRAVREEEVAAALRAVAAEAEASRPVDMRARLSALVADTTVRAVVGGQWKHWDVFLRELDRTIELASAFSPADVWPSSWLAGLVSGNVFGLLDGVINDHLERMGDGRSGGEAEDLVDVRAGGVPTERFEAGAVDGKGGSFELLPFGAGRRMCPGMAFGLATVELDRSRQPPLPLRLGGAFDPAEFDMTDSFGITTRRKRCLLLRPLLRVPVPRV